MNPRFYNLWKSFNALLGQAVAELETELNTALGTSYSFSTVIDGVSSSYPSVCSRFIQAEGRERKHLLARVRVEVIHEDSGAPHDAGLLKLVLGSLDSKLGLRTSRDGLYAYHPIYDFFSNPADPPVQDPFRLEPDSAGGRLKLDEPDARAELDNASGWRDVPDTDPAIMRYQTHFKLFYRGDSTHG
ncbi:MAG: hypothetical protein ACO1RX_08435 [Candidatus Sericytochromatia bacterium]